MTENKDFNLANDPRIAKIAHYYGLVEQCGKLTEEMEELRLAIKHFYYCKGDRRKLFVNVLEELGDVKILIAQLDVLLREKKATWNTLQDSIEYEIERQLSRIGADDAEK